MHQIYKIVVACGNTESGVILGRNVVKTSYVFRRACAKVHRGQETITVDYEPKCKLSSFWKKCKRQTYLHKRKDPFLQTDMPYMGCIACIVSFLLSCVVYRIMEPDIVPPHHLLFSVASFSLCCYLFHQAITVSCNQS